MIPNFRKILVVLKYNIYILVFFSFIFMFFDKSHFKGIEKEDTLFTKLFNRLYFTSTTLSTVGYGDVIPHSILLKTIVLFLQLFIIVSLVSYITSNHK